jgi:hypothetical protein
MALKKSAVRIVIAGLVMITGMLGVAALWLDSPQGLEWARQKLMQAGNGTIEIENTRGSLLGEVKIDRLRIKNEDLLLEAEAIALSWQPWALLHGELHLNRASATTLRYQSLTATASTLPASLALPLDLLLRPRAKSFFFPPLALFFLPLEREELLELDLFRSQSWLTALGSWTLTLRAGGRVSGVGGGGLT